MEIPKWLAGKLTSQDISEIVDAIKTAESTTSGEIVPMIVRRSSTIGHVPVILLTLLALLFFVLNGPTKQAEILGDHWLWYLADIAVLTIITSFSARWQWMQRLFTSRMDQAAQVDTRALVEFYESDIRNTKGATGILIFLSLMERHAVVLADKAINDQVPKDTWQELCDALVTGIKKKNLGSAIKNAIIRCSEIMTPHFPIRPDDENELQDRLIIKE
jgi:putative membrane protein